MKTGLSRSEFPYSLFYFCSHAFIAHNIAFFPLRCQELGFSPQEIAWVGAAATLSIMLGSLAFAAASHHLASPRRLIVLSAATATVAFAPILLLDSFASILPFWCLCTFASGGAVALLQARSVRAAATGVIVFEHVRVWGSIGFIAAAFLLGFAFQYWLGLGVLVCGLLILLAQLGAAGVTAPHLDQEPGKVAALAALSKLSLLRHCPRPFLLLLLILVGHHASHAVYYAYYSVYVRELGWSGPLISTAWNIGVVAEILLFLVLPLLLRRISIFTLLRLSLFLAGLRWLLIAETTALPLLLAAQLLHAFSYGGVFIASVKLTFQMLPDSLRDRGQGLLIAFGGISSMLGMLLAGEGARHLAATADFYWLFRAAAVLAFVAAAATVLLKDCFKTESASQ